MLINGVIRYFNPPYPETNFYSFFIISPWIIALSFIWKKKKFELSSLKYAIEIAVVIL